MNVKLTARTPNIVVGTNVTLGLDKFGQICFSRRIEEHLVYWSLFAKQFLHAFRDIISLAKNPFFKCKVVVIVAPVDMWVSRKTYPPYP